MELNNSIMYLSDDDIKKLSIYLAYGAGIGMFIGIFMGNIPLYFSLGSVVGIVVAVIVCFINKYKEKDYIKKDM